MASATLRTWPRLSRRRPRWSGGCTNPQPRDHSPGWGGGTCSPEPSQIQLYATAQRCADPHSLQWLLTERLFADSNCCRDACKAFDLAAGKKPGKQTTAPLDTVTVCVLQLRALPRADLHKQRQSRADIWHTTAARQRLPVGNQLQSTTARAVIVMRGLPPCCSRGQEDVGIVREGSQKPHLQSSLSRPTQTRFHGRLTRAGSSPAQAQRPAAGCTSRSNAASVLSQEPPTCS